MKKFVSFLAALSFVFAGCEKDINIKLDEAPPKLVVEATIENGQPPMVFLSKSIGYFTRITPQLLSESIVRGAEVYVSNGTLTHRLKEYTVTPAPGISLNYYSIDSASLATAFTGQLNQSYSLRVVTDGQIYTANTTIPNITKRIDSVWWKVAPGADTTKAVVMVRVTDPPGFGDYVRVFVKVNDGPLLPPFNSAFDDLFIDGTTYELSLAPGFDRNADNSNRERGVFNRRDTVTFKLSNIDRATYDFWRTLEFSYSSVGNPFSTPTTVKSNISNGALGYFGGYASQFRTIILR